MPEEYISDHGFAIKVAFKIKATAHQGPGIWRLHAATIGRPGVRKTVEAALAKAEASGGDDFELLLGRLNAGLRSYMKEERKRISKTTAQLADVVAELRQEQMRNPGCQRTRDLLLLHDDDQVLLPGKKLSSDAVAALEADWSEQEVKQAFKALANNKSPGRDGLPKELFEQNWDVLGRDFMKLARSFSDTALLPASIKEAVTILLHKKGDKDNLDNYRPITLLNFTYKILARVVADRMKQWLHLVISEEQYGFIPGRRMSDAIGIVADAVEVAKKGDEDWYMLLVDFRKAFDSVSRRYLFSVLRDMGFPERFVGWVEGLHKDTTTRLLVNGWLGEAVAVRSGVRQGCPLAPYLFLCAVEPLAQEACRRKLGLCNKAEQRLVYLGYADDTTLFLEGKRQIARAEKLLEQFAEISEPTWVKAFEKITVELIKWKALFLTIAARVVIINCYITPKVAYQAHVYPPPEGIWKKLMKLFHNFLSGNNASADGGFVLWSWDLLSTPRADGGLGVLDPEVLMACLAARRIAGLLTEGNGKKKEIMLKAAGLPMGEDTFMAHEKVLKHWPGDGERWKQTCEVFLKSPLADTGKVCSKEEVAQERIIFNRNVLLNGTNPVEGQKEAKGLWDTCMGDLVTKTPTGEAVIKDMDALEKELRSKDSARLALKAFAAAPEEWKSLLIPNGIAGGEGEIEGGTAAARGRSCSASASIFRYLGAPSCLAHAQS
ncbi:unnamed protein product [Closterium sp. Yama58-4]|nr:unnamed protein product [Closterium sp. Yama58-4]